MHQCYNTKIPSYALNKLSLTSSCEVGAPNRESLKTTRSIISVNVCHVLKNLHQYRNEDLVVIILYHDLGSFKYIVLIDALHSPIPRVQH